MAVNNDHHTHNIILKHSNMPIKLNEYAVVTLPIKYGMENANVVLIATN